MKSIKYPLIMLLSAGLVFASCKKDDDDTPEEVKDNVEQNDDNIASNDSTDNGGNNQNLNQTKDVATQKADIENAGIKLVSELRSINESKSMTALASFSSLGSSTPLPLAPVYTSLNGTQEVDLIKSSLKASAGEISEDFADETGIYTWNPSTMDWDKEASSNVIKFIFPATENGTTNNATLAITEAKTVYNSQAEDNVPESIAVSLTVDGATVMTYSFSAGYDSDGIPTSIATKLTMEPGFVISASLTVSDTEISESYSFTSSGSNILSYSVNAKGMFTEEKMNAVSEEMNTATTLAPAGEMLSSISVRYQVLDIAFSIDANTAGAFNRINPESEEIPDAAIFNDNLDMKIAYSDGTPIATAVVVIDKEEEEATIDLIFSDNSRVSAEAYFEQSMSNLEKEVNALIEDLSGSFDFASESNEPDYNYYTDSI